VRTYVILLGAPGAGKGTQAEILDARLGLRHVSSGEIFREHIKNRTELGLLADRYMSQGNLVPDDVTIAMIRERLGRPDCEAGALLDGFPRTPAQVDALEAIASDLGGAVRAVLCIEVPAEELVRRLSGRWMCRAQGHIYQLHSHPPRVPGVCDIDGSALYQRDDDTAETVRSRLQVYTRQTAALADRYRAKGLLSEVDGTQPIEAVTRQLLGALRARGVS
jgi:adenylate kinase